MTQPSNVNVSPIPGKDCYRCGGPVDQREGKRQFIYCASCRAQLRDIRIREQVELLDWPDEIYA